MVELNNGPDKPHRKCARIVGDTMGKYHPHGDSSIYGALVNMAQDWSTRYPLVDGHGNFGSVDGDGAAAMRYTEARLSKISMEMLADIGKDTVDFSPNFDETEKEPVVLPSRYPNLLVNGTAGIAVGMATSIPPHNLREVIKAVVKIIDNQVNENRETEMEEILEIVKGPDFPTGATILGKAGIEEAYRAELAGRDGRAVRQRIARGFYGRVAGAGHEDPEDGYDVVTTLDLDLQDVADKALRQQLERQNALWGTTIVMETRTGEILALANLGRNADGSFAERENYALSRSMEPDRPSSWRRCSRCSMTPACRPRRPTTRTTATP